MDKKEIGSRDSKIEFIKNGCCIRGNDGKDYYVNSGWVKAIYVITTRGPEFHHYEEITESDIDDLNKAKKEYDKSFMKFCVTGIGIIIGLWALVSYVLINTLN